MVGGSGWLAAVDGWRRWVLMRGWQHNMGMRASLGRLVALGLPSGGPAGVLQPRQEPV